MTNDLRGAQLRKAMGSPNEFCVMCYRDMGFPKSLHIDHPARCENGANYTEGCGQCCGECEKKVLPAG